MLIRWQLFQKAVVIGTLVAGAPYIFAQIGQHQRLCFSSAQPQFLWLAEHWTSDDKPYQNIQHEIDKVAQQGQLTVNQIEHYRTQRQSDPQNPRTLFRWVYATYQAQQMHPPVRLTQVPEPGAFQYVVSPQCYQYTRLRFLTNAEYAPEPQLVTVAKRLLQHEPDDYDVQYYLVKCYKPWMSDKQKHDALMYAQDLIQKMPNKPSARAALGDIYHACWVVKRDVEDGQKAVAAYQEYLKLAPENYAGRAQVQKLIRRIQTYKAV